jgi:myo-inositol-1(or 4)-monophosphatase
MLTELIALAQRAGALAQSAQQCETPLRVEQKKSPLDVVTQADRDVEALLREALTRRFPGHGFVGEEGSVVRADAGAPVWVVDPIDGTSNFARGGFDWAVSIGLYDQGRAVAGVIHAPRLGLTLAGAEGQGATLNGQALPPLPAVRPGNSLMALEVASDTSSALQARTLRFIRDGGSMCRAYGSSTVAFLSVARGLTDAYIGFGSRSWDVMAGSAILSALGAQVHANRPLGDFQARFNLYAGCAQDAERWRRPLQGLEPGFETAAQEA